MRRTEKKLKEICMQVEDERRHADQFKEQVCLTLVTSVISCSSLSFERVMNRGIAIDSKETGPKCWL